MKFRSLMTAICVLAAANIVSAAPFAYVANSGTKTLSVIDTVDNTIKATVNLPDTQPTVHPYAYGIAVGASGQYVYVGLQDTNEVAVIDSATNAVVKRIGFGTDVPGGLAVNAAETRLYVAGYNTNILIVIDITGTGATEVGRVTVENAAISNPSGVIINTAGDKAYVANSSSGTVAEVSLDEASNVYTRLSLTSVGASAQPVGLTINSDSSKLYVSSLAGSASVIDIATKAVTTLPVGTGTATLAIKPDNSKVYAPSNSLDKLYVIDSAANPNVVLGTQYAVAAGPFGSSLTPDGSKLYLTMNTWTAGNEVKVFDTATNAVTATITLPAGAKPTSMGNFVGPLLPYTINATNGANCTISPVGIVPVNDKGRTFSIAPLTGACEVKVDGVSVGQPSAYTFTNVTNSTHTIDASQIAGTFYTVTANWISSVGGWLESTPIGINSTSKSAKFAAGSTVTIKAGTGFNANTWTGACAGTPGTTCTISNLAADQTLGATVVIAGGTGPIYNSTKASYYSTITEAFAAASAGDTIKITSTYNLGGTTNGPVGLVTLSGNWSGDFSVQSGSASAGALIIGTTGVIANNLTL